MAGLKNNSRKPKTYKPSTGGQNKSKYDKPIKLEDAIPMLPEPQDWRGFMEPEAWSNYPDRDGDRLRLKNTLLIWANREESLEIQQFTWHYRIAVKTFYRWLERYQDLSDLFDEIKIYLQSKRRIGAHTKKYDRESIWRDMHNYDVDWFKNKWADVNKYHVDLKNADEKADSQITVVLQQVESTGKVRPLVVNQESTDTI